MSLASTKWRIEEFQRRALVATGDDRNVSWTKGRQTFQSQVIRCSFSTYARSKVVLILSTLSMLTCPGYTVTEKLGSGGFGVVHKVIRDSDGSVSFGYLTSRIDLRHEMCRPA